MSARMHAVPADRIAIAFPFAHIGGLALFFVNLLVGCSSILVDQFGDEGIETLARHGVTLAGSGTPFNLAYLRAQRQAGSRRIFPAVRAFPGGGSTRPPGLHRQMQEVFGAGILSGYGLTETGFLAMADIDDPDEALATTEGRPYPDSELRIVDPVGRLCDRGQEGEICARGPMVMAGYSDRALDSAFDSAGFFHTGDLGRIDSEGFLHLTGRIKDIIIRKGENISAREVEEILNEHPGIEESAVIGVPDPDTGERCCAVVVPSHGASDPTLVEIGGYLRDAGLSVYKIPERLEVVDSLPKNASGKITKHVLIRQFTADEVSSGH
jgi:acyl-CoA synthetase (AMP-forming)/AMP-acid ligase II